ncbi:hypothetical protein [Laspinema olomoucense]|uniref:Nif11 domain-containing protein n=1 Tax=Laspinema olomoucense D3b TaxID=2953688 RepID=A0ABT2N7C1_9CYAN|nr:MULTISPECIES: hypothetical protein [unclassified Laspinema]MCT7975029.1 hypothetical protein [Laspinema sp. D3d]MCT7978582.1 hypothetical protein [Laspinema sp. D3b]MCT7987187.1 hypothetical protein [Laspinema sp. D3a]MCT7992244.1 hypothetical protein [Laspinema sp. D3c]
MSSSTNSRDPFFTQLLEFSKKAAVSTPSRRWRRFFPSKIEPLSDLEIATSDFTANSCDFSSGAAEPLCALKERDTKALAELFEDEEIDAIQADVLLCLSFLSPAPCWDEQAFEFLKEFL